MGCQRLHQVPTIRGAAHVTSRKRAGHAQPAARSRRLRPRVSRLMSPYDSIPLRQPGSLLFLAAFARKIGLQAWGHRSSWIVKLNGAAHSGITPAHWAAGGVTLKSSFGWTRRPEKPRPPYVAEVDRVARQASERSLVRLR